MNIKREQAGGGHYGDVFRNELPYINDEGKIEYASFCVIKKFKDNKFGSAEENAKRAVINFNIIKNTGLKLETRSSIHENVGLSMYNLSPDRISVVMNDLEIKGWRIINKQYIGMSEAKNRMIKDDLEVDRRVWENLVDKVFLEAIKAKKGGVELRPHCFKYLLYLDGDMSEVDFILADFDELKQDEVDGCNMDELKNKNLSAAHTSLTDFIYDDLANTDDFEKYEEILDSKFAEFMKSC
jgi:hypothetical protein